MKKKRKRKNRVDRLRFRFMAGAVFFLLTVTVCSVFACQHVKQPRQGSEMRAVWLAYVDYKPLGLYNKTEAEFRENAEAFFQQAEENSINTVFFHVRAFRDTVFPSDNFPMSRYIWSRDESISYDPLDIMVRLAHKYHMQIHAWLNPYRNRDFDKKILNPALNKSTEEILLCIREILERYDVDGIHFDDYFYKEGSKVSEKKKKENVNAMIKAVYKEVKECGEKFQFGISPAGNISYCESIGADVKTWLSQEGYVDYIIPQIYWTDRHSASWREKMFTDTLDEWIGLNERNIPLYVGLALYRTGQKASDDPGWGKSSSNLAQQIAGLREKGCNGFALFSAKDFLRKSAQKELTYYRKEVVKK